MSQKCHIRKIIFLYGFYYDGDGTTYDGFYYYQRNIQGDIIALLDDTGDDVVTYTYDSWGKLVDMDYDTGYDTLGADNPFRYRGYYYDTETGLYYLNQRYYNPEWGRFINADNLIGETGDLLGHNVFAYCQNNPVMLSDPSGQLPATFIGAILGAVIGGVSAAVKGESIVAGAIGGAISGAAVGLAIDTCGAAAPVAVAVLAAGTAGYVGGYVESVVTQTGNGMKEGKSFEEAVGNVDFDQVNRDALYSGFYGSLAGAGSWAFKGANRLAQGDLNTASQQARLSSTMDEAVERAAWAHEVASWQKPIHYWGYYYDWTWLGVYTGGKEIAD